MNSKGGADGDVEEEVVEGVAIAEEVDVVDVVEEVQQLEEVLVVVVAVVVVVLLSQEWFALKSRSGPWMGLSPHS